MPEEQLVRLREALSSHFDEHDADCLSRLLALSLDRETTGYEDLDLICPDRDDHILTLFEERVLMPVHCLSGSSWEERGLRLDPGEHYFLPAVARAMLRYACWTGQIDSEQALTGALATCPSVDTQDLVRLLMHCREHTTAHRLEAGIIGAVARKLGLDLDLHQAVDLFVAAGILSPCKGVSQASGLSWYEMNACLFWDDPKAS